MRRYTLFLAGLVAAIALALFWFVFQPADERTQLVLHNSSGTISSGGMLGVRIGDSWREADAKLRARFNPNTVLWQTGRMENEGGSGVQLGRVPVLIGEAEVSYDDDSWRNGWVTLELKDGVVTRISWGYCPFCVVF